MTASPISVMFSSIRMPRTCATRPASQPTASTSRKAWRRWLLCDLDGLAPGVFRIAHAVGDMDHASFESDPTSDRTTGRRYRVGFAEGGKLRWEAERRGQPVSLALATEDRDHLGFAEPS